METLYAGPIYSVISKTCKLYDQLIFKYHALFDRYLPYDKMVIKIIKKQLAPKNSRELENFWADLFWLVRLIVKGKREY